MNKLDISFETVRLQVADIFEQQLGLPREEVLAGKRFIDLDPGFDSLSLVQAHLFLEEAYETRFERLPSTQLDKLPTNIDELVSMLLPRLQQLVEASEAST